MTQIKDLDCTNLCCRSSIGLANLLFVLKKDSRIDDIVSFSLAATLLGTLAFIWLKIKVGLRRSIQLSCLLIALGLYQLSVSWLQ